MEFRKYQHVERLGTDEVDGIEIGECWIFPKVDGTNGSVYLDNNGNIKAGSRKRELTLEQDNAGFYAWVLENENIRNYLQKHPTHRLFGEFLVPHTLKTYRDDAWRRFYIFDVCIDKEDDELEYIPYPLYQEMLEEFDLDYVPPIAKIKNPTYENLVKCLEQNAFLVQDGKGTGEGIVVKNYDFYNKYKRQVWAKLVANEFKEKHSKEMGCTEVNAQQMVEEKIVDDFCTAAFIEKEFAKIVNEKCGWKSEYIPMLFGRVFHELVKEEAWNIVKKYKNPKIDFKTLNAMAIRKIKEVKCDLFA
jgi:hypothetical protein